MRAILGYSILGCWRCVKRSIACVVDNRPLPTVNRPVDAPSLLALGRPRLGLGIIALPGARERGRRRQLERQQNEIERRY